MNENEEGNRRQKPRERNKNNKIKVIHQGPFKSIDRGQPLLEKCREIMNCKCAIKQEYENETLKNSNEVQSQEMTAQQPKQDHLNPLIGSQDKT